MLKPAYSGTYPLLSGVRFTKRLVTRMDLGPNCFSRFSSFTIVRPVSMMSSTISTFCGASKDSVT
ncbi:hypothetical protein TYRP_008381 [Tyrophagus putrescentiae]|nr:hypothetical protein TYRP_008381 [Tyrophagus putrescentiae]